MTALDPQRDFVPLGSDDGVWARRLCADAEAIESLLPAGLRSLHDLVVDLARERRANALILTGSTARGRRTDISDLDYHLIGASIETPAVSHQLDLHVLSPDRLEEQIRTGDDFVQWSLRFGRVIFDDGTLLRAVRLLAARRPWPDADRKRRHAATSLSIAARIIETGDQDGALVQVRTALSLAARAYLLASDTFPLARAELPAQLAATGFGDAAEALRGSIEDDLGLNELSAAVRHGQALLDAIVAPSAPSARGR
jgi:hypothetical protein